MRSNNRKNLPEFPIPTKLVSAKTLTKLDKIATTGNKSLITESIYTGKKTVRGKTIKVVRDVLRSIYYDKCAYCEDKDYKPEVEHYRPKKKVKEDDTHPGYYWLCYEWTNLLPGCHYCNADMGKRFKFPIAGTRVSTPSLIANKLDRANCLVTAPTLLAEKPLLLHPEVDTPESGTYFSFKKTGEIIGIDPEGRAAATIEVCNLNRGNLLVRRLKMVTAYLVDILEEILLAVLEGRLTDPDDIERTFSLVFTPFLKLSAADAPFSLFALYAADNFREIIGERAGKTPEMVDFLCAGYDKFLVGKPAL